MTILQVAKEAGVSVATVSRVINQRGIVKEATVRKVMDTVERLGYAPNQTARNLRKNETRTILVLLPNITNQYYANVFDGLNDQAQKSGYNLFLSTTQGRDQKEILKSAIEQKQADGAVLLAINREEGWVEDYSKKFPLVQCCEFAENCFVPHVSIDNYKAAYEATQYLIQLKRRKIAILSSTNHFHSTWMRQKGYQDAMRDHGLAIEDDWIAYMDDSYSYASASAAAKKLLSLPDKPDGIFCVGDESAFATTITAKEMGIRVPEELSVIGVDDICYTTMLHPHLTSVAQPCKDLGRTAVRILTKLMRGEKLQEMNVILPYGFKERESTCVKP